ncbi:hypothetical protein ABK040_007761 [Willaertia magna]
MSITLLNVDELKYIFNFLDISSVCALSCVSKTFILSTLSVDDFYWKNKYTEIIEDYFQYIKNHYHSSYTDKNLIEKEYLYLLQRNKDFKIGLIEFIGKIVKEMENCQKKRFKKNKKIFSNGCENFYGKEELLKNCNEIQWDENICKKELKITIKGDGACGKTSFVTVFDTNKPISRNQFIPTVNYDNEPKQVMFNNEIISIKMCDTPGSEEYSRMAPLIAIGSDLFIIAFSIGSYISFESVAPKWIAEIQYFDKNIPFVLCGLKKDYRNSYYKQVYFNMLRNDIYSMPVSFEEAEYLAKSEIGALGYFETSSLRNEGFGEGLEKYLISLIYLHKLNNTLQQKKQTKNKCFLQ